MSVLFDYYLEKEEKENERILNLRLEHKKFLNRKKRNNKKRVKPLLMLKCEFLAFKHDKSEENLVFLKSLYDTAIKVYGVDLKKVTGILNGWL